MKGTKVNKQRQGYKYYKHKPFFVKYLWLKSRYKLCTIFKQR